MLSLDRLGDENIVAVYQEAWGIDYAEVDGERTYAVARAHEMLRGFREQGVLQQLCTVASKTIVE